MRVTRSPSFVINRPRPHVPPVCEPVEQRLMFAVQELLTNGSFSAGTQGWLVGGDFWAGTNLSNYRTAPGYAAGGVGSTGAPKSPATGAMSQQLTVPANATAASLRFWYYITSDEPATGDFDKLSVQLTNTATGTVLLTQYSNRQESSGYVQTPALDLMPWKGQTLRLNFLATTDAARHTVFRIDDASVSVDVPDQPIITAVSPNPATGSASRQWFTITGSGFQQGFSAVFRDETNSVSYPAITDPSRLQFVSASEVRVFAGVGVDPATWSVQVVNPGNVSSPKSNFQVVAPTSVTVTTPNGGEVWKPGQAQTIGWSVTGSTSRIHDFLVSYSLDDGATFSNTVGTAAAAARSMTWTPPLPITAAARLRVQVRARDASGAVLSEDASNGYFSIKDTGAGPVKPAGIIWKPAHADNYSDRPPGAVIDSIVIHTAEGRDLNPNLTYQGSYQAAINWFQTAGAGVSAHYVIGPTGEIVQMVSDEDAAIHATYYNARSIGIEVGGFAADAGTWNPQNLAALESLVAWLAVTYDVPVVHPAGDAYGYPNDRFNEVGIVAHSQVQPWNRGDPGPHFQWASFMTNVRARIDNAGQTPPWLAASGDALYVLEGASLTISRGTVTFTADASSTLADLDVVVEGGAVAIFNSSQHLASLRISGGTAKLVDSIPPSSPGSESSRRSLALDTLSITNGGTLDVSDNELIIAGGDPAALAALIRSARNSPLGRWQGSGLTSSAAATNPLGTIATGLAGGGVLVRYTYNGDANLDGRVNADDYFRIDQGFLAQPADPLFSQGDFNYDGRVNADDYFLIDQAFLGQGAPMAGDVPAPNTTMAPAVALPVPTEPEEKVVRKRTVRPLFSDEPVIAERVTGRTSAARRR